MAQRQPMLANCYVQFYMDVWTYQFANTGLNYKRQGQNVVIAEDMFGNPPDKAQHKDCTGKRRDAKRRNISE